MKRVLVTGANGHVGLNLVQVLLERGYHVRAGVRDPEDPERTAPLRALGAEVVRAELLERESLARALEGMDGLFQNAAVYRLSKGDEAEIRATALTGSENALRAAHAAGVRRVVYTSSVAAVGPGRPGDPPRTEEDWARDSVHPYMSAKRDAERQVLELARAEGLELASVLPGHVLGPGFHRHTPSTVFIELLLANRIPAAPLLPMYPVDARDVGAAMVAAYERPQASGRYLLTAETVHGHAVAALMRELDPAVKVPGRLPAFLQPVVPAIDALNARLMGLPHLLTRAVLDDIGSVDATFDSSRARAELGWHPRSLRDTLRDTMDWIRAHRLSMAAV